MPNNDDNLPKWDLSNLFSSAEDPRIFEMIESGKERAKEFRQKYYNTLEQNSQPQELLKIVQEYENILSDAVRPQVYGELIFTVQTRDPKIGAFLQKVRSASVEIFSELLFFELELTKLPEEIFEKIIKNKELENYRHYFEKLHAWKIHRLSEQEEKILEYKSLTGKQAFARLFEQELSQQKFTIDIEGKIQQLNESQILNLLHTSEKQEQRKAAALAFTKGLLEKKSVLTFVTNTLAEDKKVEDNLRKFEFPEQARHLDNEASKEAVEAMAKVVEENYPMVQEYYTFKKEVLGLEKMYDFDRYASVNAGEKTYTFSEAKEIVLDAFGNFNQEFRNIAEQFFQEQWIDAALAEGKRGGAYCSGFSPNANSYIFMNFTGSVNDVMTLAHELGHGINNELSRCQNYLNYFHPLTLAETASIFAETLVFERLVAEEKDEKKLLALYMQKIESIFASVQRQISMFRFEQDLHSTYREKGELASEQINQLWKNRQQQMFGDAIELTPDYDNWWMYIPHFIHTPFYVYAYAFGEMLALGLLELNKQDSQAFYPKYKQFLEAGSSQSPKQLTQLFDVDLNGQVFWQNSMKIVTRYLEKAKKLHEKQK